MEAFVYCWTNHKKGMLYVGSHKGSTENGYICSSVAMLEEYSDRPDDFTRQIVAKGSYKDIRKLEEKILKSANAMCDPTFYNMSNGAADFYLKYHTEKAKKKIREKRAQQVITEETKKKMSLAHKGIPKSEEWKEKNRKPKSPQSLSRLTGENRTEKQKEVDKMRSIWTRNSNLARGNR